MNIIKSISALLTKSFQKNDLITLMQEAKKNKKNRLLAELESQRKSLTKKDISDWRNAHQMAINPENPNRIRLYSIYDDCIIDNHLTGCISQRNGITLSKVFKIIDKNGEEVTEATELFEREWFADFIEYALEAIYWGHSLIEFGDVIREDASIRYNNVSLIPRENIIPLYGMFTKVAGDSLDSAISYRDSEYASSLIEIGKANDLGLLLKCAPSCISKKNMLAFWDMFGEIFGMPIRIARTSSYNDDDRQKIENALKGQGAGFWSVLSDDTEIQILGNERSDAYQVYDKRIDRANSELSKAILGQTMTIDNGSSHSQSEVHLEILKNITTQDARRLKFIINDKLIPMMIRDGFPLKGLSFAWDDAMVLSPNEWYNMEALLLQHYDIDPKYFIDKYNVIITGEKQNAIDELKARNSKKSFFD